MRGDIVIKRGFGKGCQSEAIDSVITADPKTIETVAHESKQTKSRVRMHLKYWEEQGLFYEQNVFGQYLRRKSGAQPGNDDT